VDDEQKLRQHLSNIGGRYLARTLGELQRLKELLAQVEAGTATALKDLEHAAHRIHGSGAMFGFHEMSDRAGDIERIAGHLRNGEGPDHLRGLSEAELRSRLAAAITQLDQITRATAQSMGIADAG
jgi:chemotaxis protein histidine kinase CheA